MVNERTTVHPECTRTLRAHNFFVTVTRDYVRCPRCGFGIYPDSASGRFDVTGGFPVARGKLFWIAVEVKYGGNTSLPFSRVSESQRDWYKKHKEDYDMWLWFCVGSRINDTKKPRKTWLIPFKLFLELEETLGRKSIPANCDKIKSYELLWKGDGFWEIPAEHMLWDNAVLE